MIDSDHRPLLAIDTSSSQAGIALYDGHRLSVRSWPAARTHTTTLLAEIHHLLERADITPRELAAVAIATGPGTFTGLRVGFGVAKGLHLVTSVPLIGVSTLEAAALPFAICGSAIVAAVTAGRGRLVWAHYRPENEGLVETRPPRNGTVIELVSELAVERTIIVIGEFDDEQADQLTRADGIFVPARALRYRQPAAVAEIGWRRLNAGHTDDATAIEPTYLSR
ncbi:MAG: tRNA (adenosine(37)-N6)-threonylcarbamoyltransferase complex dimerization subunit type 1 TsaB [Chloroflexia bacterium]|nr:tRNA (adenosine(37)-N6)-threonylcarbamoyltransferase complex dimerization subunit type 1 TsaB [Chloroflexia bacterium]